MEGPPNFRIHRPPPPSLHTDTARDGPLYNYRFAMPSQTFSTPTSGPLSVVTERENDFRYTKDFTRE